LNIEAGNEEFNIGNYVYKMGNMKEILSFI